jgi:hypothetical protein
MTSSEDTLLREAARERERFRGSNGGPWYTRFIASVGVPSAIALFLVWFLSSQVMTAIQEHADASDVLLRELLSVSRQICLNTSDDSISRAACITLR